MAISLIPQPTTTPTPTTAAAKGNVVTVVSHLPLDLERDIFEWAALAYPSVAPKLLLVARRVQAWLEPVIYRVIVLDYPFRGVDLFMRTLTSKPPAFFHKYVKTLCITASVSFHYAERVLSICTGVEDLICWSAAPMAGLLPVIQNHPLRKLSIKIETVFPADMVPNFKHPMFSRITHLDIVNPHKPLDNSYWHSLADLPTLTHLALGDLFYWEKEDICDIIPHLLSHCDKLEAMILVCGNDLIRKVVQRECEADERLVLLPTFHHPDLYPVYLQGLKSGSTGMWKHAAKRGSLSQDGAPKIEFARRALSCT